MEVIKFDTTVKGKPFKMLNATNGGPWHNRKATSLILSNFEDYKKARIPYARNHDMGCTSWYGGPYAHDITKIYRNFDADEYLPSSYDFACTDESILTTLDAGTETFFRLGESAESIITPHALIPPKDFEKWARICEHIIRHYNEGWANGYNLNITYWEIWNEADLRHEDVTKGFWCGPTETFFDFYAIVAKHLKSCFPHLKIGGPSLAHDTVWAKRFLQEMKERDVPIDFFSWHCYATDPTPLIQRAETVRELLDSFGYNNTESICNEWNYVSDWGAGFIKDVMTIHGIKGALFTMACLCESQKSDAVDMLMYYSTEPSHFCGAFDYYTCKPLKGYYSLMWYGKFYDMAKYVPPVNNVKDIYTLCGVDENGKIMCLINHYSNDDETPDKTIKLDFGKNCTFDVYLLDDNHDGELIGRVSDQTFTLKCQSCILLKEVST